MSLGAPRVDRHGCGTRREAAAYRTGSEVEEQRMGIIWAIIIGFIVGLLAKLVMPGRDPGGFIVTIIIGILGAVVGGFIGTQLGLGTVDGFNMMSFALAVLGAIILLFIYRLIKARA